MFLDVMGEIPLPINHKKSQKEEGGGAHHAVQVLVHHNNKHTMEKRYMELNIIPIPIRPT